MANTARDVGGDASAGVSALRGVTTKSETINSALRETVPRLRRADALARLSEMGEAGAFDELLDRTTYRW